MSFEVDPRELNALGYSLQKGVPTAELATILAKSAADVAAEAKRIAPVDTGNLRSSISPRPVDATTAEVVSNTNYSVFVEYGTRRMAPRPHMRPALEKVAPAFAEAVAQLGEKAMLE